MFFTLECKYNHHELRAVSTVPHRGHEFMLPGDSNISTINTTPLPVVCTIVNRSAEQITTFEKWRDEQKVLLKQCMTEQYAVLTQSNQ